MNCDHDLVAPILDQSAGQKFFFGHGHFAAVEENQAGAHQHAYQGIHLRWRQRAVATELQDAIRVQVVLLDLQVAGLVWPGEQGR